MDKEELKRLIVEANTPEQYETLANRLISTSVPWFFTSNYGEDAIAKYSEFKWYMSSKFRITANDVSLAGSAWLGYSLNPKKNFRDFREGSDIDIVIVSQKLFNSFCQKGRAVFHQKFFVDLFQKGKIPKLFCIILFIVVNCAQCFYRKDMKIVCKGFKQKDSVIHLS